METLSTQQLKAIAATCAKLHLDKETKAAMVESFSGGRCSSSKYLTKDEARAMLMKLNDLQPIDPAMARMKNKIFYYAHEMGWVKVNKAGKVVADGERVDNWCLNYSYLKKKLNNYTYKELPKLVSQFEAVYKHFLKTF